MSTFVSDHAHGHLAGAVRKVQALTVSVPAGRKARAAELEAARRIYGFDVSDEERAARVRVRHSR